MDNRINNDIEEQSPNQPIASGTNPPGPMSDQASQPIQQNTGDMNNRPMMQPNMQGASQAMNNVNMGQYPVSQPMRPPKQPMDSAKKKKIILTVSIISGVVILATVATVLIIVLSKIDYGPAYRTAKQLEPKVYDIYQSYDCDDVVGDVNSAYVSINSYNEDAEGCKKLFSTETDNLVSELENSDAVKRNDEIKAHFENFKSEYVAVSAGNTEELSSKIDLWKAWHGFVVTEDDLTNNSSDAEFTTAANYLINSGNDTLKTFGETWLQKTIEVAAAYRAYDSSIWSSGMDEYYAKRDHYYDLRDQRKNWIATNKPDINTLAPLSFNDASKMYSEFGDLYKAIKETYQKNYNQGSGDCDTFLGEVYCD